MNMKKYMSLSIPVCSFSTMYERGMMEVAQGCLPLMGEEIRQRTYFYGGRLSMNTM